MMNFGSNLDEGQRDAVERAAYLVLKAQDDAARLLQDSGIDMPADNPFASPCQGSFDQNDLFGAPPHGDTDCACSRYKGDGGPCINTFINPGGAGFGDTPRRKCGHPPSLHFRMD